MTFVPVGDARARCCKRRAVDDATAASLDLAAERSSSTSPATASATPRARSRSSTHARPSGPRPRVGVRTSAPRWLFDLTRQGQGRLQHARVRHRRRPDRQPDARRGRHASAAPRRSTATSSRARPSETRVAARARRRPHRRRHPAAGLRGGALAGHPVDRRSATSPGTGSTPTTRASGWRRRCCRPSASAYAKASMALRLPMHGGFESFSNVKDIPFIARHATRDARRGLQAAEAARPTSRSCSSSFGGYGLPGLDTDALAKFKNYTVRHDGRTCRSAARAQGHAGRRARRARSSASTKRRCTTPACATRTWSPPPTSSSPSPATASSPSASPTTRPALHLARPLPRVRRAGRGDAEVPAVRVHQPRRSVRRQVGDAHRQAAGAAEAQEEAGDQRRRRRRGDPAEGAGQAAEEAARTAAQSKCPVTGRRSARASSPVRPAVSP